MEEKDRRTSFIGERQQCVECWGLYLEGTSFKALNSIYLEGGFPVDPEVGGWTI